MDSLFLLRAYGDFIIALTSLRNSPRASSLECVVSSHLSPLYQALPQEKLPADLRVHFHDFGIGKGLMRCFTNKYLLHMDTLRELWALRRYINTQIQANDSRATLFLENTKRAWLPTLLTGRKFAYVIEEENVYESYQRRFQSEIIQPSTGFDMQSRGMKVLLIPDARLANKTIPSSLIKKIHDSFAANGSDVTTAFFQQVPAAYAHAAIAYHDFKALIDCIQQADLVIGADSMPVHLCQFLNKPHYMLYPGHIRRYERKQFFTPFVLQNRYYASFEELEQRTSFFQNSTA